MIVRDCAEFIMPADRNIVMFSTDAISAMRMAALEGTDNTKKY